MTSQPLNRRIHTYLLALWGATAIVGAIGFARLSAVHSVSNSTLEGVAPSVEAAFEVEHAVQEIFVNTFGYCSYGILSSRDKTHHEIVRARKALDRYAQYSVEASPETIQALEHLVEEVSTHARDCILMTDDGMSAAEFGTHLQSLGALRLRAALRLREAASKEQQVMLNGLNEIDLVTRHGLMIFGSGTFLLLLITVGVGAQLSRTILPPVRALTEAAGRFSATHPHVRVEGRFRGEFDVLSRAFNGMAQHIQTALRENSHLFKTVKESREKFRDLYDHAPDGYHSLDSDGVFVEINATLLKWLGYSREELMCKQRLADVLTKATRPRYCEAFSALRRGVPIEDVEVEFERKDGSILTARINSSAVFEDGRFIHSRDTVRDITKEVGLRRQLVQAQKLESIGTLAGGIAHDFNNLLTSIMGFAQLGKLGLPKGTATYQHLDRVDSLGQQAADLIKQLLTFSRQTPTEKHAISLGPLVKETTKVLERILPETIQIVTDTSKETSLVEANATQMQQVLMNLCVNARDAMPKGGTLRLSLDETTISDCVDVHGQHFSGEFVTLKVQDTGSGIPRDVIERIFEPFYTTKAVGEGTGLGLSIIHGIVQEHGGHIQIQTGTSPGTTFTVLFPVTDQVSTEQSETQTAPTGGSETILVVEDDENVRDTAEQLLGSLGYAVLTADSGEAGLKSFDEVADPIDLVITDLVMPGLGGLGLIEQLGREHPSVPVILSTGYDEPEQRNADLRHPQVANYLPKPFNLRAMAKVVRDTLDEPVLS